MKRHHSTAALLHLAALAAGIVALPSPLHAQERDPAFRLVSDLDTVPLAPPKVPAPQAPRQIGPLTIDQFRKFTWSGDFTVCHFEKNVRIRYSDPQSSVPIVLDADVVDFNLTTGELSAKGDFSQVLNPVPFRLTRQDAVFTGRELNLNVRTGNGVLTNADLQTDMFHLTGERIILRDQVYLVTHGTFTTCIHRRPDYHITAKDLRVVPNKEVKAHGIYFYAGPTRLIGLPYFRRSLAPGTSQNLPITPTYNHYDGPGVHYQDNLISHEHELLHIDATGNFKRAPTGYVSYQKDLLPTRDPGTPSSVITSLTYPLRSVLEEMSPPTYRDYAENSYPEPRSPRTTFYAVGQNQQYIYNRKYNDLGVSRFPEVGVRMLNLLGSIHPENPGDPAQEEGSAPLHAPHNFGFATDVRPVLDITAGIGGIEEFPTKTVAGRAAFRASLASTPLLIGSRLSARAGITDWANFYSTGNAYNLFSPEVEFNYAMTRTSSLNAGYSFFTDMGTTPFLFDRRDVRQELRLGYHVNGPIGFGYITKLDIGRSRFYDSELALTRNFDCMQVGLSYRLRSQSIGIIFSLLPPSRRARDTGK